MTSVATGRLPQNDVVAMMMLMTSAIELHSSIMSHGGGRKMPKKYVLLYANIEYKKCKPTRKCILKQCEKKMYIKVSALCYKTT